MTQYFVTRHDGAREWARRQRIDAQFIDHLDDTKIIQPNDVVMGTLPLHMIEAVLHRGGRYQNLNLESSAHDRGGSMSADDMERAGAKLVEYMVTRCKEPDSNKGIWKRVLQYFTQLTQASSSRSLLVPTLILILFILAVSTNIAASAFWVGITKPASPIPWVLYILTSLVVFFACSWFLYLNRHRIIDHSATITDGPNAMARQVLIMGFSPLRDNQRTSLADLQKLVDDGVSLNRLAGTCAEFEKEKFQPKEIGSLPWLQSLRAVRYHSKRLERIYIVPSNEGYVQQQEFNTLLQGVLRPFGVQIDWVGQGINYEDYNAVQRGLDKALKLARDDGYADEEISIDVTPGYKPFSIVAAAMTFGPGREFLYVNFEGKPRSYDARIKLAGGLLGD